MSSLPIAWTWPVTIVLGVALLVVGAARSLRWWLTLLAGLVPPTLLAVFTTPADLPTGLITAIHEGRTGLLVPRFYGGENHGLGLHQALKVWTWNGRLTLVGQAWLDGVIFTGVLFGVGWLVWTRTRRLTALLVAVGTLTLSIPVWSAAFSEEPFALCGLLLLLTVALVDSAAERARRDVIWFAHVVALAAVTFLAAGVRPEVGFLPAVALVLVWFGGLRRWPISAPMTAAMWRNIWIFGLMAGVLASVAAVIIGHDGGRALTMGLSVFAVSDIGWRIWPSVLMLVLAPVSFLLLVWGGVVTVRRSLWGAVWVWALLAVVRVYIKSGHDGAAWFELRRYLIYLVALFAVLIGDGAAAATAWLEAHWPKTGVAVPQQRGRRPLAGALVVGVSLLGGVSGLPGSYLTTWQDRGLLSEDSQREARFLLKLMRDEPQCAVVVAAASKEAGERRPLHWVAMHPDRVAETDLGPAASRPSEAMAQAVAAEAPGRCAWLVRSLDAHRLDLRGRPPTWPQRAPDRAMAFHGHAYSVDDEYGPIRHDVYLAAWRVAPATP